jgi:hypothetical protein
MKSQLKSMLLAVVLVAISLGAAQQAQAAKLISAGYSWTVRADGERRTVTYVSVYHKGGEVSGWAEFEYTDQGTVRHDITSAYMFDDGTLCMAGPLTEVPDPALLGWTAFFAVRDNGRDKENPDTVTLLLIAPPDYPDVQSILDYIGGFVPEDKFVPITGGRVKVFVK